jgi:endonuclease/exonuclease/phosphatase (EEP) superfamily protein YafD
MKSQLNSLAQQIQRMDGPVIVFGDFNNMPWSNELSAFQSKTDVSDSRRSQYPTYHPGAPHLFDRPVEHIFYSKDLQCLDFDTHRAGSTYLGTSATFRLKTSQDDLVAL